MKRIFFHTVFNNAFKEKLIKSNRKQSASLSVSYGKIDILR